MVGVMPKETMFIEFPKIARLSRECIVTELTSFPFNPYSKYGNNDQVPELRDRVQPPVSRAASKVLLTSLPLAALDGQQSRAAKCHGSQVSGKEIRRRRPLARRQPEIESVGGVDGGVEIQTLPRLRWSVRGVLHGLRSPGRHEENLQFGKHVRPSLRERAYRARTSQVRLGLLQLPQSQNTK